MPVRVHSHRLHQPRVDARELSPLHNRSFGNLEEVQDLPDPEPVAPTLNVEHDDCALVGRSPLLLQEKMSIEHGQQAAPDVHQPLNFVRHPGNSGGRKAGEDLTHDPCRGRADNLTDSKDDGVKRGRVSHLY